MGKKHAPTHGKIAAIIKITAPKGQCASTFFVLV